MTDSTLKIQSVATIKKNLRANSQDAVQLTLLSILHHQHVEKNATSFGQIFPLFADMGARGKKVTAYIKEHGCCIPKKNAQGEIAKDKKDQIIWAIDKEKLNENIDLLKLPKWYAKAETEPKWKGISFAANTKKIGLAQIEDLNSEIANVRKYLAALEVAKKGLVNTANVTDFSTKKEEKAA